MAAYTIGGGRSRLAKVPPPLVGRFSSSGALFLLLEYELVHGSQLSDILFQFYLLIVLMGAPCGALEM